MIYAALGQSAMNNWSRQNSVSTNTDAIDAEIAHAHKSFNVNSKAQAIKTADKLPITIQSKVKDFFKGGSNAYKNFSVEMLENGNYVAKMTKPGNVPGSEAVYIKEISPNGNTIRVFKETYDPLGNLVHIKNK